MRKQSLLLVSISLLLFGLLGTAAVAPTFNPHADSLREPTWLSPQKARPITLAEAKEIVEAYATQWQAGARVVHLTSIDHPEDSPSAGRDGRRRAWQAVLLGTNPPGAQRWVTLVDGSIVEETEQPPATDIIPLPGGPLPLDSPDALRRALAVKPDFTSANGKGKGFHFALERSPEGLLVIMVRGARGRMPAVVSLDATTGEVLAARSLTFGSGGILYSADAGRTWHASNLRGRMVTAIGVNPLDKDQAYAVTPQDDRIAVYQTRDGGRTWTLHSILPEAAGDWPYSFAAVADSGKNPLLLVGTPTGLWVSTAREDWFRVSGLPEGPKQWLAAVQSQTGYRVFVSITAGEQRGVYASNDLSNWVKLADGVYRLSESFDRKAVLAMDEQRAGPALLLTIAGEAGIEVPELVLHAAGDFTDRAPMILHVPSGVIWRFRQEAKRTLPVSVASLAAAPDFPTSGVAIAGGFRTGIYRTTDAGQTWHPVLADPSAVLPGSGEIGGVAFLSPVTVIAVNGGELTWRDF